MQPGTETTGDTTEYSGTFEEQFEVLEQIHPDLNTSYYSSNAHHGIEKLGSLFSQAWNRVPIFLRFALMLVLAEWLVFTPVICIHLLGISKFDEYSLFEYQPYGVSVVSMEILRWTLFAAFASFACVFTVYSSKFIPQLIAYITRRSVGVMNASFGAVLELISFLWRYFCYLIFSFCGWLLTKKLAIYAIKFGDEIIASGAVAPEVLIEELSGADKKSVFGVLNEVADVSGFTLKSLPWQYYFERSMLLLVFSTFFLFVEKVIVHFITNNFNKQLYDDRITKVLYSLWSIRVLRKAANVFGYKHVDEFGSNFEKLWHIKEYPYGNTDILTLFMLEHFVKLGKKTGERKQAMARRLFAFLHGSERRGGDGEEEVADDRHLKRKHFAPFFTKANADTVFAQFDARGSGDITESEFCACFDEIYKERADLVKVLTTNSQITASLDHLLLFAVIAMIIFIIPIIALRASSGWLTGLVIAPIPFAIFFGRSVESLISGVVFIFSTHPYDVGDRVYMDKGSFFVRQMGLLSTTFERWDGFIAYYPNHLLASKAICNVRRTAQQSLRVECCLPSHIPTEKLTLLDQRLDAFIASHDRDFDCIDACSWEVRDVNRIVVIVRLKYRYSMFLGLPMYYEFMTGLKAILESLDFEYYTPITPIELILGKVVPDDKSP